MQIIDAIVFQHIVVRGTQEPHSIGRVHPGCTGTVRLEDPANVPDNVLFAMEYQGEVYAGVVPAEALGLGGAIDIDA